MGDQRNATCVGFPQTSISCLCIYCNPYVICLLQTSNYLFVLIVVKPASQWLKLIVYMFEHNSCSYVNRGFWSLDVSMR
jgi:hypothetical protein